MKNYRVTRTVFIMLLAILGASIGAAIFFYGTPSTPQSQAIVQSTAFVTWFFINEVLFAFYPILAVFLWKPLHELGKYFLQHKLEIVVSALIAVALFILPPL